MIELSKTKLNIYSRLGSRKQREKLGLFLAEGAKCVADSVGFFHVEAIIVLEAAGMDVSMFDSYTLYYVSEQDMRRISQLQTLPDIVAVCRIPDAVDLDGALVENSLTLMLDAVQDPGNLGTILRIASWFGIPQVVLGAGCADPYNPKAVQSSMGAVGMVRIVQANIPQLIDRYPTIPVCGTLLDGRNIYETALPLPAFVVMGNEGNGLSDEVRLKVNMPLLIPSFAEGPHAESLNVAAATAVTVSEFLRSRS